jgi:hypothetical protein
LPYNPIAGKTYSLFDNSGSTEGYYKIIRDLTDQILEDGPAIAAILKALVRYSLKKAYLKRLVAKPYSGSIIVEFLHAINGPLSYYTQNTPAHLKHLPLKHFWDRRLATTREQYHVYMLEIELTNRLYADDFKKADRKIALLPYCLQDFSVSCRASLNGFDYQCNHCSGRCFENHASRILEKNGIEPYIWRGADFKKLAANTFKKNQKFAILGIACIPELAWGMRKCRDNRIPVLGLPLNANRCMRWFGEFLPNSVDLNELKKLVQPKSDHLLIRTT